ncbi:MAG: hypothetical protein Q7S02_02540 [bacterium]|nr:hypothetical protein [bacterium]
MLLDNRKLTILFAVIDEYVTTAEPVASQAIVSRRAVDAGPATIRNEMATLEEDGYLMQPHTSAGRVPTERAYRLYIEAVARAHRVLIENIAASVRLALEAEANARAFGKAIARLLANEAAAVVVIGFERGDAYATGISYLVAQPEFQDPAILRTFSAAVDRLDETIDTLDDLLNGEPRVLLGAENPFGPHVGTVASHLALPEGHTMTLGIVGPMRMAYDRNFGIIETVQAAVSG